MASTRAKPCPKPDRDRLASAPSFLFVLHGRIPDCKGVEVKYSLQVFQRPAFCCISSPSNARSLLCPSPSWRQRPSVLSYIRPTFAAHFGCWPWWNSREDASSSRRITPKGPDEQPGLCLPRSDRCVTIENKRCNLLAANCSFN